MQSADATNIFVCAKTRQKGTDKNFAFTAEVLMQIANFNEFEQNLEKKFSDRGGVYHITVG